MAYPKLPYLLLHKMNLDLCGLAPEKVSINMTDITSRPTPVTLRKIAWSLMTYVHYTLISRQNNCGSVALLDRKGRLWIGTSIGLNLQDGTTDDFERFYMDNSQDLSNPRNDVKAILEDGDGQMWFGTGDGLYKLRTDKNGSFIFERQSFDSDSRLSNVHVKNILEDPSGNFWIGTLERGLIYWNRSDGSIDSYANKEDNPYSLSHNNIRSLLLDEHENIWVGTFDGLNYKEKGSREFTRISKSISPSGLTDKSIRSLFMDKRGSLWVGTYYGGINHLDENYNRFKKNLPSGNGLNGKVVSSFAEDHEQNLWIGTEGDGLQFFNKSKNVFETFLHEPQNRNSLSGNNVKQLLLDGDELWVGTFQAGLNLMNTKTRKFQRYKHDPYNPNTISGNNVYGLIRQQNHLWILTYGAGLDILDLSTQTFKNYAYDLNNPNSISSNLTRVLLRTRQGQFWIGTERGLNKVTTGSDELPVSFEVFLSDEKIYSLTEDQQGYIWIGTFGNGFYRLDPSKNVLEHYTVKDGLPGNSVLGILEVSENELWISTNSGLSKFDPSTKTFANYDYSNGLENSEYNFNAYLKDSDGDLLFGGLNGFNYFNPKAILPNEYAPPIVFTELRKNNQIVTVNDENELLKSAINETEEITFKYKEANFSIHFAALDYFSPNTNQYAFMLEGIDNDWNYSVGETEATYTIQRSGEYTFRLKSGNSEGLWNPEERSLQINVLPPLWNTWWAYLLYLAGLALISFGFYRFIKLRHNLQLEKIVNQQQADLHETKLRFFTNITHEFRTPLTLITAPLNDVIAENKLAPSVEKKLKTIERNAQRMLNLVNQILTFRKLATDHAELSIVKGNIVEFLQEIFLLFRESANRKGINYQFQFDQPVIEAWFDQDKIEKVIFNLLSNAFKFTPEDENISISVSQGDQWIEIKVCDSGPGIDSAQADQIFKRFYEKTKNNHSNIKGSGIGLAISKQMVELHQGMIFVGNQADSPYQQGATFIVQIPRGNVHFGEDVQNLEHSNIDQLSNTYLPVVPQDTDEQSIMEDHPQTENPLSESSPKILIVEDNKEVRHYIKQIFESLYHVITAKNGEEGIQKAKEKLPDLILSDVMMPVKDGITLCQEIKADFEISHIPVILLTARAASLFKLEGLKTGADDYITKPFNPDELRLRVRNILKARQDIRTKFKRLQTLDPEELNITSADELFLEKALQVAKQLHQVHSNETSGPAADFQKDEYF